MKDLNLEQLGVQELNAVEVKKTDGGGPYPRGIDSGMTTEAAGFALGVLAGIIMGLLGQ